MSIKSDNQSYADQLKHRDIDPSVLQAQASDPDVNVWVNASAGTGKTKVLTDRVLRLLLPRHDGRVASHPSSILCLTFTKAGASEMILRVQKTLAKWVTLPIGANDDKGTLRYELCQLFQKPPTSQQIDAAQELYRQIIDLPDGLKIMTIHSFCQSILARFPLEAGIAPDMSMLDEGLSARLIERAAEQVYKQAKGTQGSELHHAIYSIARIMNHDQFMALFSSISKERETLRLCLDHSFGLDGVYAQICDEHGVDPAWDDRSYKIHACDDSNLNVLGLRQVVDVMMRHGSAATNSKNATAMAPFLECETAEDRALFLDQYMAVFFTAQGALRKTMATKAVFKDFPEAEDILATEAGRLLQLKDKILALKNCHDTRHILTLGKAILDEYERQKVKHGVLDFDDQILKTLHLLRQSPSWVMYKLDRGLDHLLVDEAQDTNPEQWEIIECLCREFFQDQQSFSERPRSVFVVGDEKQSIYGFQRAAPAKFHDMKTRLRSYVDGVNGAWDDINMQVSFRTTPPVLQVVDHVFSEGYMRDGVSSVDVHHIPARRKQAGLVELWPMEKDDDDSYKNLDLWKASLEQFDVKKSYVRLAEKIADKIKKDIENCNELESYGRPVRAGDYMVLVRRRTEFVGALMRALKVRGVPVSGADRMILSDQLSVMDLLALSRFLLLPNDDLSVCEFLKSPLIGFSEQQVYDVSVGRMSCVFDELNCDEFQEVYAYLNELILKSKQMRPYELFVDVLSTPCPMHKQTGLAAFKNRLGEDVVDPLYEFLSLAMDFERNNVPTLQNFYQWFEQDKTEIKRDTELDANEVRIMTVHGSKGLQAPIVILPDTLRSKKGASMKDGERILWPHKTGLQAPIWSKSKITGHEKYLALLQKEDHKNSQEDRRLLYVAMTRAEERLYVCGYHGKDDPKDDSWYFSIKQGMKKHAHCLEQDDGVLQIYNPRSDDADKVKSDLSADHANGEVNLPQWIYDPVRKEEQPPRPYAPSRSEETDLYDDAVADSQPGYVFAGGQDIAILRGNITHKLLEVLPNVPPSKRDRSAQAMIDIYRNDLTDQMRHDILREVLTILNHDDYKMFFDNRGLAEVPIISALDGDRILNGIIDRLYVDDDAKMIWIIDYKTNRNPPQHADDIPRLYRQQMRAYHDAMIKIYPDYTVQSALLWTASMQLMTLDL